MFFQECACFSYIAVLIPTVTYSLSPYRCAMKTSIAIVLAAVLTGGTLFAQDAPAEAGGAAKTQLGLVISGNITRNIVDYHVAGPVRSYELGSLFGIAADIPIGQDMAVVASLGYYTLAFKDKNTAIDMMPARLDDFDLVLPKDIPSLQELTTEGTFNYFTITPMFRYYNFCVGFSVGIPLGATITNSNMGSDEYIYPISSTGEFYILRKDISPPSSERNLLVEGRIAGDWALMSSETGSLHFNIMASYPFTDMIKSNKGEPDNLRWANKGLRNLPHLDDNFRLPSIQAGISYLFNLSK